jgi:hypothetical protein
VGRTAVQVATSGEVPHGSIVIRRVPGARYAARFEVTELRNVAKETRDLDEGFLAGDNDIAPSFLDYVRPLVGALPAAGRLSDHPLERR